MKFWVLPERVFVELKQKVCPNCNGLGQWDRHEFVEICSVCGGAGMIPIGYHTDEHMECLHPNDPDCNCWNCQ